MKYTMTTPCDQCPFLAKFDRERGGFTLERLSEFASGEFPCHKSADLTDEGFTAKRGSVHCAGALIFNEKRAQTTQMMRICERLGMYDASKLDMSAPVR